MTLRSPFLVSARALSGLAQPLLVSVATLALALGASGCEQLGIADPPHAPEPMGPPPLSVSETFFTEPNEFTPAESDAPLDFALTLAVRESRPTLVVSGRYNLPAAARARYGDDPRHAIYLIALNTEAFRIHAAPVGPPRSPTTEPPAFVGDVFADEGSGEPLRGVFSVDVPVALGLPNLSAPYQFFLWMDEHVTPRQTFINPSNSTPREGREVLPVTGPAMLLQRTESDLAVPGLTVEVTEGSSVVQGVVAHELDLPEPVPLVYIAVERPANLYGYARVVLSHDDDSSRLHYDLDVRHLFFNHEPEGRLWVLGLMGAATSTPASLRVPERPAPVDGGVSAPVDGGVPASVPALPSGTDAAATLDGGVTAAASRAAAPAVGPTPTAAP